MFTNNLLLNSISCVISSVMAGPMLILGRVVTVVGITQSLGREGCKGRGCQEMANLN